MPKLDKDVGSSTPTTAVNAVITPVDEPAETPAAETATVEAATPDASTADASTEAAETAAVEPVPAFVMKAGDKFTCVVEERIVGRSKHQDYFSYHYGRHDLKGLEGLHVKQFVYLDENGGISFVVDADKTKITSLPADDIKRQAARAAKLVAEASAAH